MSTVVADEPTAGASIAQAPEAPLPAARNQGAAAAAPLEGEEGDQPVSIL